METSPSRRDIPKATIFVMCALEGRLLVLEKIASENCPSQEVCYQIILLPWLQYTVYSPVWALREVKRGEKTDGSSIGRTDQPEPGAASRIEDDTDKWTRCTRWLCSGLGTRRDNRHVSPGDSSYVRGSCPGNSLIFLPILLFIDTLVHLYVYLSCRATMSAHP